MDLLSIAVGVIAGGSLGYIAASIKVGAEYEDLMGKYEELYRDYSRLTDRDERGRFVKREK